MKNIHVLPTDKPSKIALSFKKLFFNSKPLSSILYKNQNICITSDDKFVCDEYVTDGIEVIRASSKLVNAQGLVDRRDWKKIVLTTDTKLIEDGVQPIDDEFLKWFVNNPSCEKVEIYRSGNHYDGAMEFYEPSFYKIIIPKKNFYCGDEVDYDDKCLEQCENCNDCTGVDYGYLPKEESYTHIQQKSLELSKEFVENNNLEELMSGFDNLQEPRQETLLKATELFFRKKAAKNCTLYKAAKFGTKWQQERSYSEEDFKLFARQYFREIKMDKSNLLWEDLADKCLEQFKKK